MSNKKVMLIDDDRDEHELFGHQLHLYDKHFEFISAYDGEEALRKLEKVLPDYIFLDMNMPKLNGLQVLQKLKSTDAFKQIPVYIYSTSDGYLSRDPALKLGALNYFTKPTNMHKLQKIFKTVFS